MLVVLTETYCNKVNIQKTQRDDIIRKSKPFKLQAPRFTLKSILITKFIYVFLIFPKRTAILFLCIIH